MTGKALIEQIRSVYLFSALNEEQLERVADHATRVTLDERQMLFSQGDLANRFFVVLKGQVRLFRLSREGEEKIVEIVVPGQTFAEALAFLKDARYPVCAGSLCKAEIVGIDARDFALMLRESIETCFVVLGALSQRLHALIGEIDNLTLQTATGRFARYLLKNLPAQGCVLDFDVRKSVIASRISIKPETFSRIVKTLRELDIIEVNSNEVTVLNREALQKLAKLHDSLEFLPTPYLPSATPTTS